MRRLLDLSAGFTGVLDALQPLAALTARLYVVQVFFLSGLTKLRDRGTTLALSTDKYNVPLQPVLLVLGVDGRFTN